jgi:hypothetical protein
MMAEADNTNMHLSFHQSVGLFGSNGNKSKLY